MNKEECKNCGRAVNMEYQGTQYKYHYIGRRDCGNKVVS